MGERILITGANGFIGYHLQAELERHGYEVVGVDRADGDLRVNGVADDLIGSYEPDTVVHLAAKVGREFGEDDLGETIADNATMTALVAKACGVRGIRLAYASTSEVYGDNGDAVCDEINGPFRLPYNLYGMSKGWGEHVAELYAPQRLTILRFSMPYGQGHYGGAGRGRAAINNMLHQALHGRAIPVHKGAERSWCWIGDTVCAVRLILDSTDGGIFNVGRDDQPTPMLDVARRACELTGADPALIREVPAPSNQTVVKRLATARVRSLGWEPQVDLDEGMGLLLEWVRTLDEDGNPPALVAVKPPRARRRRV